MRRSSTLVGISILGSLAGLVACSESADTSFNTVPQELRDDISQTKEAVAARADFTTPSGRKWKYVRDVHDNRPEGEWERRQAERAASGKKDTDLTTLSREQLAEDFRGISLINGKEYVDAEPNWHVADLILSGKNFATSEAPGNPYDDGTPAPETLQGHNIIGSDNRSIQRSNRSFPFSVQVAFQNAAGYRCSGTMIGPSTMISAAHCFHTGSGYRNTDWTYYFGADRQDGTIALEVGDYVTRTSCYVGTISTAYANGNTDRSHDHAVVEFYSPCGARPGYLTGWLGTWAAANNYINDVMMYVYGYPGSNTDCPGNNCYWPSIWGHGSNQSGAINSTEMKYKIDTSGGQSGSGVYRTKDGYRYVVGIHTHGDANWNKGRRITSWLIGWLEDNSDFVAENSSWSLPSQ